MENTFINIALAFIEGLGLIASPCILPILPIVLSGSLEGSKKRPMGIICSFVLTFAVFTFFSRKLVQYSGIDLSLIRTVSFGLLFLLGLIMLSTFLTEKFSLLTQKLANIGSTASLANNTQGGFVSGLLFGCLIALIWTPCAGPILAAVIVQTVTLQTNVDSFLVLLSFALGAGIPMILIALFGRALVAKLSFLKQRSALLRKILGSIILLSVGFLIYSDSFSTMSFNTTHKNINNAAPTTLTNGLTNPYPAPAIEGISHWINSEPLQLDKLKGKVVLIDFWTYSCINCIRTLPYLTSWYNTYHDKGLVIIGVHAPEFDFEKNLENVQNGVKKYGILYPVALDNNFVTWRNFKNRYWPAHYLIDKNGNVVYEHFGEGEYDVTENNIRFLLGLDESTNQTTSPEQAKAATDLTPETYLGYARAENYSGHENFIKNKTEKFSFPQTLKDNEWALQGKWTIQAQQVISAEKNSALKIRFHAKKVFIVMGNITPKPINIKLLLDGKFYKNISVTNHNLYEAITLNNIQTGILELRIEDPGLEIYTFTFGA